MFKIDVLKIMQYLQGNTCVGVGSLFLIKLQAQWLLLIGVKFSLKNVYVDAKLS